MPFIKLIKDEEKHHCQFPEPGEYGYPWFCIGSVWMCPECEVIWEYQNREDMSWKFIRKSNVFDTFRFIFN